MHFPHKLYSTLNLQKFLHLCLLHPHSIYPLPGPGAAGVLPEEQGEEERAEAAAVPPGGQSWRPRRGSQLRAGVLGHGPHSVLLSTCLSLNLNQINY